VNAGTQPPSPIPAALSANRDSGAVPLRRRSARAALIALRGNGAEYPENTLPALRSALELGVPQLFVETQLSRDAEAFVLRDADPVASDGGTRSVLDLASGDVAMLDASDQARFGDRFAGVRVPRLTDVARLLLDWPETQLFVELCRASLARHGVERFVAVTLSALRDCPERCVLVSRDLLVIELARRRGAQAVGWIVPDFSTGSQIKCEAMRPDFLFFPQAQLAHGATLRHGLWQWVALDVADVDRLRELALAGADYVATAHVRAIARELGLNATRNPPD
jgi:glycerophosphoryl diester phosphodiesterase